MSNFQGRVNNWMHECFDREVRRDIVERGDRFLEEALEFLQSNGYDPARIPKLVAYVYGRPPGNPEQELGGVMVTLAAYSETVGLHMEDCAELELERIEQPSVMRKIQRKQAAKRSIHDSPLPGKAE